MKKRWILLQIFILVMSVYNCNNALEILSGWHGNVTIHYWINWVILIFSICCGYVFGILLGWKVFKFLVKEFKKWIVKVVQE